MALIKCSECGKEISSKARAYPNCGNPIYKEKVKTMKKKMAIALMFIVVTREKNSI